ncbi:MAG: enoyl-CoA hydratase-related protein [Caulobacterales bacterium]|jgi:enoyl-CoA hydratase/carnithine racemase
MSEVLVEARGSVLWMTINRPDKRNALSAGVVAGLGAAVRQCADDPAIRVGVITGAGEKAFCAGADLDPAAAPFQMDPSAARMAYPDLLRAMIVCPKPIVARINGACVAGGAGLVAAADIAIAAPHAQFGLPEAKVGVFPMMVAALLLERLGIGARAVSALALEAGMIDAGEAARLGIYTRVAQDLDAAIDASVALLLANSPTALRLGKRALETMRGLGVESALTFAEAQIKLVGLTQDAREGVRAFGEKCKPNWSGQ